MKKKLARYLILVAIFIISIPASAQGIDYQPPEQDSVKAEKGVYIVQMLDDPVVSYEGGIPGFKATQPTRGEKVNPKDPKVVKYVGYLDGKHDKALEKVGAAGKKLYDYRYSYNGFAAKLTPRQAALLSSVEGVISVQPDTLKFPTTENSPTFLGLNAPGGLWEQLGGIENAGEGIIIGVVDTGIWPEHPSFSDRTGTNPKGKGDKLDYHQIPGWHGKCVPGEEFTAADCNQKLIGAQYFYAGFGLENIDNDYLSARDHDGHGTHTASTAGGNYGITAKVLGNELGMVSGMAPRARIAMYKACWNDAGCATSDLTAAIDQAVADGVDVINYSIGGGSTSLLTADAISFLFAARAGIFVATSAGNSGPGASTLGNPAVVPWVTSVGASTQNRTFEGSVALGDGSEFFGASITMGTEWLPIVDAADAFLDSEEVLQAEECWPGYLDPAVVTGKIVLCKRGTVARVDKSLAVATAGGLGMVLYNTDDFQTQDLDSHWVPSVHIDNTDGLLVKAYIESEGTSATAMIQGGQFKEINAPWMGAFSSRGPNGGAADLIKPDVTAPGVNILAGNTPTPYIGFPGQYFQVIGGTSMASPHVAGVAALIKQAHSDWTPAMIKSAIMTSADPNVMKEDGATPADPFDMGAGHLNPNPAVDPGLVYNAQYADYLAFLCGSTDGVAAGTCALLASMGYSFDPSELNLASIGIASLPGVQTVTRTVTSVTPGTATYSVAVEAPPGIDVEVSPQTLTLNKGESAEFQVTFTAQAGAVLNEWTFGSLTWSHAVHNVRSPIAVRPVALAAPAEVNGMGVDGSLTYAVTSGFSGDFAAVPHGLIPAATTPSMVLDDPANDINAALGTCDFSAPFPWPCTGITWHAVPTAADTNYLRVSLFDDYTDGEDDLDLYVFDSNGVQVGSSGSPTSAEEVNILDPSGTYLAAVHGWQTDGTDANYTLFTWALGAADAANLTVTAPAAVAAGASYDIGLAWTGLDAGVKYLGSVTYHDVASPADFADGLLDVETIVRIDTD